MTRHNTILHGDECREMTLAYLEGARACRRDSSWHSNPYRSGSQKHEDWSEGHTQEAAGEHFRFGIDLVETPAAGEEFGMDPSVPRDGFGVDIEWYRLALAGGNPEPNSISPQN